jgi:2-oxoglutarate ferredoxin oxidoreductase subunit beta
MTGGQVSPTTPHRAITSTTQKGNIEYPFDLAKLVAYAGASYSARWTTMQKKQMQTSIEKALKKGQKGFAFIEIISPCPTQFTRRNINCFKTIKDKLVLGELVDIEKEGFVERIRKNTYGEQKPCMLKS